MAPIRAYFLPADSASAIAAVSIEQLDALGWKILSVAGGHDEIEQAGQKFAQELGFPITQEGCIIRFDLDIEKKRSDNGSRANGVVAAVTSGSPCIDVEDVTAPGWVRIHLSGGTLLSTPSGAKYRVSFNEQNKGAKGIALFKETISNHGLLVNKEIDSHPARQAYLKEVGQT
ncbi:hypothetical protein BDP27DRAFT_1366168 [Rhodocollybia butyracea]|uniref:Uncharacterized protein n=1 Tax=Rhodocollybia butyracea TaxID=206335 RepID=A0A9P5PKY3_9AGAR|nr:hypothetical protein BDP27DRAFT_1366168 [Rhodocollybia butyracea]